MINVAVGILHNSAGEVLIAKRPETKYKGGFWEFPGGKIEPQESIFQALQRELQEEINIQVIQAESWLETEYHYSDRHVILHTWRVTKYLGKPHGQEGQEIRWVLPSSLSQFVFPEGNHVIIECLMRGIIDNS